MDSNLNGLILDLYNEAQSCSMMDFSEFAIGGLKKFIKFDSAGVMRFHVDESGKAVLTAQAAFNVIPDKAKMRAEYIGAESYDKDRGFSSRDPLLRKSVSNPNQAHVYSLMSSDDAGLKEYGKRAESLNSLNYVNKQADNAIQTLSLWRAKNDNVFVEEDIYASNLLVPHVLQAIKINRGLVRNFLDENVQSGFLIVEDDGLIHHIDDVSVNLLRREYSDWLSYCLPSEIFSYFSSTKNAKYIGNHIIMTMRRQGSLMMIGVQPKEAGRKLTPAELRVVEKIVLYGSYKEVARHLGVSPNTIRNQLYAIYEKLGIKNKSELINIYCK